MVKVKINEQIERKRPKSEVRFSEKKKYGEVVDGRIKFVVTYTTIGGAPYIITSKFRETEEGWRPQRGVAIPLDLWSEIFDLYRLVQNDIETKEFLKFGGDESGESVQENR